MDNEQSSGKKKEEFGKNKKDNKFLNFNSKTQIEIFGNFIKTQKLKLKISNFFGIVKTQELENSRTQKLKNS